MKKAAVWYEAKRGAWDSFRPANGSKLPLPLPKPAHVECGRSADTPTKRNLRTKALARERDCEMTNTVHLLMRLFEWIFLWSQTNARCRVTPTGDTQWNIERSWPN